MILIAFWTGVFVGLWWNDWATRQYTPKPNGKGAPIDETYLVRTRAHWRRTGP